MKKLLRIIFFSFILLQYVFCLIPSTPTLWTVNKDTTLSQLISDLQKLNTEATTPYYSNFQDSFSTAVKSIHAVAGLHQILFQQPDNDSDQDELVILITIRTPHVPAGSLIVQQIVDLDHTNEWHYFSHYKSHIDIPPLPPPIRV